MSKEPEIHLTFDDQTADVTIEVFNVTGKTCDGLSKPYTDLYETVQKDYKSGAPQVESTVTEVDVLRGKR